MQITLIAAEQFTFLHTVHMNIKTYVRGNFPNYISALLLKQFQFLHNISLQVINSLDNIKKGQGNFGFFRA